MQPIAEFIDHNFHEDERRRAYYNLVPDLPGQMCMTDMPEGTIAGMHMHKKQTDYFTVARGRVLFRLVTEGEEEERVVLSPASRRTLIIKPGIWHGYKSLEPSILVFYVDHKYDPADEFRRKTDKSEWEAEIK